MPRHNFIILIGLAWASILLACNLGDFTASATPTPTPTIRVAKFATFTPTASPTSLALPTLTPIVTLPPTETPTPEPTFTATPLPSATSAPEATATPTTTATPAPTSNIAGDELPRPPTATSPPPPTVPPPPTPTPEPPKLSGRIAFAVDDSVGHYDLWMVELDKRVPFQVLRGAHQPNFSNSGQLLVNNETSPNGENIGWLDASNTWRGLVSDAPEDRLPFWSPQEDRYVFVNPRLLLIPNTTQYLIHLFIPCSLQRPTQEGSDSCRDTAGKGKLVPGDFPVWTEDYRIAYLNTEGSQGGIYIVSAGATLREPAGDPLPQRIVAAPEARPSDTQGNKLYFSAKSIEGNWEAYVVNLDSSGLLNLSNSPDSQDGLPTVSPDGAWVAFVSDRDEHWGIWITPSSGGTPFELVNLSKIGPSPNPWGIDDRDWTHERITWGP